MLTDKRAPLYISLCLILCLIGMALCTILVQSRPQSAALWAERAADLYASSLDIGQGREGRAQMLVGARASMLNALQYDPYNAAHWMRLSVIDSHSMALENNAPATIERSNPVFNITKRLRPNTSADIRDYILPSAPPRPRREPD